MSFDTTDRPRTTRASHAREAADADGWGMRSTFVVFAAIVLAGLLAAPVVFAEATAKRAPGSGANAAPAEAGTTRPPPGTLGAEGMVPTTGETASEEALEPIGHIPGPGEGVYGDPPNSGTGNPADRPWSYDPTYFFALTHGLETETDLTERARRWVSPLTFTFDVLTLPTAALAGLSGRSPQTDDDVHGQTRPETTSAAQPAAAPTD